MRNGFTLSEALITIVLLGLVVALTTPRLIQNYKNRQFATTIQKFTVDFAEAIDTYMLEEDKVRFDQTKFITDTSNGVDDFVRRSFKVGRSCDNAGACFNTFYRNLDNSSNNTSVMICNRNIAYTLVNSTTICIDVEDETAHVVVDINGPSGPNKGGRDLYNFNLDPRTGHIIDEIANRCGTDVEGSGCINRLETNEWIMN